MKYLLRFLTVLFILLAGPASAAGLWSIYWVSAAFPCSFWGAPVVSSYGRPLCPLGAFTICPTPSVQGNPFDGGQAISITGWQITQILSDPTASGFMVVGSAHSTNGVADGGDVFASGGGVGTWTSQGSLSPGMAQGGTGHIDAYTSCDKGTQQLIVVLPYSAP
jgi:hypothetical protein